MSISATRRRTVRSKPGMTFFIIGPQGAGKGTQAELFARRHHYAHLETGAMLRQVAASGTLFGKRVARQIDQGKLVPFTWVLRLLEDRIRTLSEGRGIVIDGSPRRLPEALALVRLLRTKFGREVTRVFSITVSKREAIRRLSKRWVCEQCHRSLTMGKDIRKPTDTCPTCGGRIQRRADETPAAIAKRLSIFHRKTRPVITYFRERQLLSTIRGEQSIKAVAQAIENVFQRNFHEQRHR